MSDVDSTKDTFFQLLIKRGPTEKLLFTGKSDALCSQISYWKGFLKICGCKKAVKPEEVIKSHPEKLAMWGVLQNREAISNKKSSGTPKPKAAHNPEHAGASELLSWRPHHVGEDSWQPLLWHFCGWRHSLWEGLTGLKRSLEIFPIVQPHFFLLIAKQV